MGYLSKPNKRDREIQKFARKMTASAKNSDDVSFYTTPLGFYDHCADEYEILITGIGRETVKKVFELVKGRGPWKSVKKATTRSSLKRRTARGARCA